MISHPYHLSPVFSVLYPCAVAGPAILRCPRGTGFCLLTWRHVNSVEAVTVLRGLPRFQLVRVHLHVGFVTAR